MEDKLEDLEILGISGLDAAAVGTAMVGGEAVLVYDYDKCVELIIAAGNEVDYAEDYILELSTLGLSGLPIFVNFDNGLDYYGEPPSVGATTVH